jgi:hypothetical protein
MKALKVLALSVLMMLASVVPSHAMVIKKDDGGVIVDFLKKWVEVRRSSEKVIIDGECNSACTLLFGFLSDSQFCVTSNAWFGFHSATKDFSMRKTSRKSFVTLRNFQR